MRKSLTLVIGGEAGQGLATVGQLLAQALTRAGHDFITYQGYHSRIRGGHNQFFIRICPEYSLAPEDRIDVLVALDEETLKEDGWRLRSGAIALVLVKDYQSEDPARLAVPYLELGGSERQVNMVALGILVGLMGLSSEEVSGFVSRQFKGLPEPLQAFAAAYEWIQKRATENWRLAEGPLEGQKSRLLMDGAEALALGALAGGIKFCSFYPMTPGSSLATTLAAWSKVWSDKLPLVVEQAEDEIAAINMAIGAAFAGAPALVTTSGGGFALMCEGVSLSGMTETPVVIVVAQRPGPATGLPTRTEQGDLELVLYAGHGGFPRAILAPAQAEDCFHLAARAARLAEKSQGPVFILSDQFLADSQRPLAPFDLSAVSPVNPLAEHKKAAAAMAADQEYQRYEVSEDGISPRLLPGYSEHLVMADSDEHTPDGHLTEDLKVRVTMQDKRLRKAAWLSQEALPPDYYGPEEPETILISWGSTKGAVLEAASKLTASGRKTAVLHFTQVWPLNTGRHAAYFKNFRLVAVEGNDSGQLAKLLKLALGRNLDAQLLRYDGLPITAEYILDQLAEKGKADQ